MALTGDNPLRARQEGVINGYGWCGRLTSTKGELVVLVGGGRCMAMGQEGGAGSVAAE